jgi:hypothetical protein
MKENSNKASNVSKNATPKASNPTKIIFGAKKSSNLSYNPSLPNETENLTLKSSNKLA